MNLNDKLDTLVTCKEDRITLIATDQGIYEALGSIENKNDILNRINNCSTNGCVDIMTRNEYEDIETVNRNFPYCVGEPEPRIV